jgi:hypothetical protein
MYEPKENFLNFIVRHFICLKFREIFVRQFNSIYYMVESIGILIIDLILI